MIDRAHQGKGYGRAAMEAVIEMMVDRVGCEEIVTSFNPANAVAAGLYASLGFHPTGEIEDDEPLVLLRVAERRSQRDH
jgi:diamine N-acetyltransferase